MKPIFEVLNDEGVEVDETLERLSGNETLYISLLKTFFGDDTLAKLRKAVASQDKKASFEAAHTIKGSSLNLGLLPVADHVIEMLQYFRADNYEEGWKKLPDVEDSFYSLYVKIKPFLEDK